METETAISIQHVPGAMSAVATAIRSDFATAIHKVVDGVATAKRAPADVARKLQGAMLHKLFHWMVRKGTHFLDTAATMERLERLAERLFDRELRRMARERPRHGLEPLDDAETRRILAGSPRPRRPIQVGTLVKMWKQLTYAEQRVLQLVDLKYELEDIALILEVSVNGVEFYLSQARQKIRNVYKSL